VQLDQPVDGVVDEELPHFRRREGEDQAAGPAAVAEVEAAALVALRLAVEEVEALVAEVAARVV